MSETTVPQQGDPTPPDSPAEDAKSKKEFEENQRQLAREQNLPDGAVPEVRPIASQQLTDRDLHSETFLKLRERGDPRGGLPAMPKAAYDKANSDAQARKAAKESRTERLYPGARGYIQYEKDDDHPDNNRAVAVVRVASYKDFSNEMLANSGTPEARFAEVDEYECTTRDGRAETLFVKAENLKVAQGDNWGRTPI